jgi:sugar phosphate isomerase/epimerase
MSFKSSVCHYSFHRLWEKERWDCGRLCQEVAAAGAAGVDFHQRLCGDTSTVRERITKALSNSGLALSGISLGNNYNNADAAAIEEQLRASREWVDIAADLNAPLCRVFGGGASDEDRQVQFDRTLDAMKRIAEYADKKGVMLALENHGGIPLTGEEQVAMIEGVASDRFKATIDVGNYMSGGQEGLDGTKIAAPYCGYVHFKDFMKVPSDGTAWGWTTKSCTVGVGAVDHVGCLRALADAGYEGWVALEYEGPGDERIGVEESIYFMNRAMARFA